MIDKIWRLYARDYFPDDAMGLELLIDPINPNADNEILIAALRITGNAACGLTGMRTIEVSVDLRSRRARSPNQRASFWIVVQKTPQYFYFW